MSEVMPFPKVVCLCGSARFIPAWQQATRQEGLAGHIVLSLGVMIQTGDEAVPEGPEKELLDELHLRKIDLADEVLVLDVDGYKGKSTMDEIRYARQLGKPIRFWSEELGDELPNA